MLIKIITGTLFGVFFIAPALSIPLERIDFTPINESVLNIGKEFLQLVLQMVLSVI